MNERRVIGGRIRKVREAAGLSQEDIGDALSLSRSAVSQWEKGQSSPEAKHLEAQSNVLKVSVDYLIHGKGKPPAKHTANGEEFRRSSVNRVRRLIATGALDGMLAELGYVKKKR